MLRAMQFSTEDMAEIERRSATVRPTAKLPMTAARDSLAYSAIGLIAYGIANAFGLPWPVGAALALAASWGASLYDARLEWNRYWEVHKEALFAVADEKAKKDS